jgi:hypothetical protein
MVEVNVNVNNATVTILMMMTHTCCSMGGECGNHLNFKKYEDKRRMLKSMMSISVYLKWQHIYSQAVTLYLSLLAEGCPVFHQQMIVLPVLKCSSPLQLDYYLRKSGVYDWEYDVHPME